MGLVLFGFGETIGAFFVLDLKVVAVVVVLVLLESLIIVVFVVDLWGTGLGAVLDISCWSSTEHITFTLVIGTDFIGLGLDAGLVGAEPSLVVKFGVLQ